MFRNCEPEVLNYQIRNMHFIFSSVVGEEEKAKFGISMGKLETGSNKTINIKFDTLRKPT